MATSSIFTNINISDKKSSQKFVDSLDTASKADTELNTKDAILQLQDKDEIKELFHAIENKQIDSYRIALVAELKKQGATESDIGLISDAVIINSISAGRSPKVVA